MHRRVVRRRMLREINTWHCMNMSTYKSILKRALLETIAEPTWWWCVRSGNPWVTL